MSAVHQHRVRVYYQDTDAGGIVYHANYLKFAERGRSEALRVWGIPHGEMVRLHGVMLVVRRVELDYQRPARLDDEVVVETRLVAVSGARVRLCQTFMRDSDSLAVLEVWLGCARLADGRAARIPAAWLSVLRARVGALSGE